MSSHRLSEALHILVHLAQQEDAARTSEEMSVWWPTNPVVIRRTLAALRSAGLISSAPGRGGGWKLRRSADQITLAMVYDALGEPITGPAFAGNSPTCLVARAIETLLEETRRELEERMRVRLDAITLADLVGEAGSASPEPEHYHV